MKHLIFTMSMVAGGLLLCLPDGAGVKDGGYAALKAAIGQGQQKAGPAPPKAFRCPQKEGSAATCPVSGQAFTITTDTPSLKVAHGGLFVYFCGEKCSSEFLRDPGKYIGEDLANPPKLFDCPQSEGHSATCPVTGEVFTIAKDTVHSEYRGKFVYFCCPPCKQMFDKEPKKYSGQI
jgi:YHS domain-containing protein